MIQIRYNSSLSYLIRIKYWWRYDNKMVITSRTLSLDLKNYQVLTLTYYRIYLQWFRYTMAEEKLSMKIKSPFFVMIHNTMKKNWKQIFTNAEVLPNKTTSWNEYFVHYLNLNYILQYTTPYLGACTSFKSPEKHFYEILIK